MKILATTASTSSSTRYSNDDPIEYVLRDDGSGAGSGGGFPDNSPDGVSRRLTLPISIRKLPNLEESGSSESGGTADGSAGSRETGRETEARQRGQEGVVWSQGSTQEEWKAWRQAGRRRSSSWRRRGERQTAQSGEDLGLAASE